MSKSILLKSSIAKKYWMALTGLFLCLFLLGHLFGNLQLFSTSEEGRRAFNEYAYFMSHNPLIKIMSYMTYISVLFHAIDGIMLTIQNKKARPVNYAYNNPGANSSWASRNMALLGGLILIFLVIHMANFWWKMKHSSDPFPLHTFTVDIQGPAGKQSQEFYYARNGNLIPVSPEIEIRNGNELYSKQVNVKISEGYKDLYSLVYSFFGHKIKGFDENKYALPCLIVYVLAMFALSFHLMHGFSSAFQSIGFNHKKYTVIIKNLGKIIAIIVPLIFAIIPIFIYLKK